MPAVGVDSLGNRPFRQLMGLWLRPGPRRGVALPAGQDDLGVDRWRHAARACLSAALVASAALCPPGIAEGESGSSLPDLPLPAAGAAELRAPESGSPERLPAETWPAEVQAALEQAGENRWALEAVLRQYRDRGDSLGLRAASFLIANMEGHSYVRFGLFDSTGRAIDFDVLNYPDYDALLASVEEIEKRVGTTDFERVEVRNDLETMPASLLIENVDCALRAWRERPWAPGLPFELFCNFVLPYRGSNEPLESWRPHFLGKYADLPQAMQDPRDPIEAARLINADLRDWFRFDPRYYHHPTDQGLSEMLANHIGRCEDMTNLTIYAMRANGLAVTSDYTPYWADAGNNHAWNAIVDARGHAVIFMGAEAQPGEYALHNKAAKVYRKSYAHQRGNLAFIKNETEKVPGWLAGKNSWM
jgi:hypothetical protein